MTFHWSHPHKFRDVHAVWLPTLTCLAQGAQQSASDQADVADHGRVPRHRHVNEQADIASPNRHAPKILPEKVL
jgi:hypothetical protein